MGKNGTKRKTKWRTLPINGSGAANTADIKEGNLILTGNLSSKFPQQRLPVPVFCIYGSIMRKRV